MIKQRFLTAPTSLANLATSYHDVSNEELQMSLGEVEVINNHRYYSDSLSEISLLPLFLLLFSSCALIAQPIRVIFLTD